MPVGNPGNAADPANRPVTYVTWFDAARAAATVAQATRQPAILNRLLTTTAFAALSDAHAVGTGSQTKYPRHESNLRRMARSMPPPPALPG